MPLCHLLFPNSNMYAGAIRILLIVIFTLINVWILESYKFDTVDDHINNNKDFNVLDLEAANRLQKTPQYPSSDTTFNEAENKAGNNVHESVKLLNWMVNQDKLGKSSIKLGSSRVMVSTVLRDLQKELTGCRYTQMDEL